MNEDNKKQFIILGVLGAVLGVVLYMQVLAPMLGGAGDTAVQARTGSNQPAPITADASKARVESVFQRVDVDIDELLEQIQVAEFDYAEVEADRDPTMPLVSGNMLLTARPQRGVKGGAIDETLLAAANRMDVTGIIWDPARPLAVVNNEVVHVGFEFQEPIVVKAIERNRVVLGLIGQDHEVVRELKEH